MPAQHLAVLCSTLLVLGTSSCGVDRPSSDEIAASFKNGRAGAAFGLGVDLLTDQQYRCIGAAIVDSNLTDDAVRALETADKDYTFTSAEKVELANVGAAIQACTAP